MPEQASQNPTQRQSAWVLAVVLGGLALRIPQLSASFYGDEGFTLLRDSLTLVTPTEDRFRPLYFSLLFLWRSLGFHGEVGLRALSLVFGVAQIPLAFALGRLLKDFKWGITLALLVAASPLLIEFSQELRMYSLVPLLALAQAWLMLRIKRAVSAQGRSLSWWIAFVTVGVAGLYVHFHYWLFLGGVTLWLFLERKAIPLRASALALGAIGISYLPNLPNVIRFQQEAAKLPHFGAADLPSALPKVLAAFTVGFNYFVLPPLGMDRAVRLSVVGPNLGLALLAAVPLGLLAWQALRAHSDPAFREGVVLAHCLCSAPIGMGLAALVLTHLNFLQPKYMVFSAPFVLLFLAMGYQKIDHRLVRGAVSISLAAMLGAAWVHFNQPSLYGRREDWRGACALLKEIPAERSVLFMLGGAQARDPAGPATSLLAYYSPEVEQRVQPIAVQHPGETPAEIAPRLKALAAGRDEVDYLWGDTLMNIHDPPDAVLAAARLAFTQERRVQLNPRLVLFRWQTR